MIPHHIQYSNFSNNMVASRLILVVFNSLCLSVSILFRFTDWSISSLLALILTWLRYTVEIRFDSDKFDFFCVSPFLNCYSSISNNLRYLEWYLSCDSKLGSQIGFSVNCNKDAVLGFFLLFSLACCAIFLLLDLMA